LETNKKKQASTRIQDDEVAVLKNTQNTLKNLPTTKQTDPSLPWWRQYI